MRPAVKVYRMSDSGNNPQRQREEATVQVPSKGGGPKDKGPEPEYPEEKKEEDEEQLVDMVRLFGLYEIELSLLTNCSLLWCRPKKIVV